MSDLENVLSSLYKMKKNMKNSIKFIEKLEKLFSGWGAGLDMGAKLGSTSLEDLTNWVNEVLMRGEIKNE